MNIAFLNIPSEIKKIINELQIPIDGLNFMPGERQAELRYKNKTIGYIICRDEGNVMHYQTQDALTQKHLDWQFVFQHNKDAIGKKITEVLKKTPSSITPAAFRQINVNFSGEESMLLECRFDGRDWEIFQ